MKTITINPLDELSEEATTYVLFLIEKDEHQPDDKGSVFAYFPFEPDEDAHGNKPCYAHVGQHSACHIDYAAACDHARPQQYLPLLSELRGFYADNALIILNQ